MPKKTKKEKIIAELRRRLEVAKATGGEVKVEKEALVKPATSYPTKLATSYLPVRQAGQLPATETEGKNIPFSSQSISFIIKDLRKTFLLAGLAISFELVVYWLTELGGSKFFKIFLTK